MINGFIKSDMLVGIVGGIFKGVFGKVGAVCGVDQVFYFKVVYYIEEIYFFFVYYVVFFNFYVVEIDFVGVEYMSVDFMQWVNFNVGFIGVDLLQGEGFFGIFWLWIVCQYQYIWVFFCIGNKGFLFVDVDFVVFMCVSGSGIVVI